MEILLLGIYSFSVWLIFIRFKGFPWNALSQVTVNSLLAQLVGAKGGNEQLREQLRSTQGNTAAIRSRRMLAQKRMQQNRELVATGAGNRFDVEQAEADLRDLEAMPTAQPAARNKE